MKKSAIHNGYLQESDYNFGVENDLEMFSQAMRCNCGTMLGKMRWIQWHVIEFVIMFNCLMEQRPLVQIGPEN